MSSKMHWSIRSSHQNCCSYLNATLAEIIYRRRRNTWGTKTLFTEDWSAMAHSNIAYLSIIYRASCNHRLCFFTALRTDHKPSFYGPPYWPWQPHEIHPTRKLLFSARRSRVDAPYIGQRHSILDLVRKMWDHSAGPRTITALRKPL